jgi:poly-beta-1,6-N-acetyl-D-glucosamine synthase
MQRSSLCLQLEVFAMSFQTSIEKKAESLVRYVVITPARNEAQHIENTLESMTRQTIKPAAWIIVDDGSSDDTTAIAGRYAERYSWISVVRRPDRGFRQPGAGVVQAFEAGFQALSTLDWQFIVKLDADLSFEPDYFEQCFHEFQKDPHLGICGGGIYHSGPTGLTLEPNPLFHVRGATKIYRRQCWENLGGLVAVPGWDTIDEVKANLKGWNTRTVPDIVALHHRFTGSAQGAWKDSVKNGLANYICGYHPLFVLLKCFRRLMRKPYVIGAIGLLWGYLSGYLKGIAQVPDPILIRYTRTQQIRRLLFMPSMWR